VVEGAERGRVCWRETGVWFWVGEEEEYQNANLNQKSEPERPSEAFGPPRRLIPCSMSAVRPSEVTRRYGIGFGTDGGPACRRICPRRPTCPTRFRPQSASATAAIQPPASTPFAHQLCPALARESAQLQRLAVARIAVFQCARVGRNGVRRDPSRPKAGNRAGATRGDLTACPLRVSGRQ